MSTASQLFHLSEDALIKSLSGRDEVKKNPGKFVGGGGDCCGSAEAALHAAEVLPEIGLTPM